MSDRRNSQQGFSLPEVLIAAAIAAGVVAASAGAISGAAALNRAAAHQNQLLDEATIIIARAQAGMSRIDALSGFPEWRIERAQKPIEEKFPTTPRWTLSHNKDWSIEFEATLANEE